MVRSVVFQYPAFLLPLSPSVDCSWEALVFLVSQFIFSFECTKIVLGHDGRLGFTKIHLGLIDLLIVS